MFRLAYLPPLLALAAGLTAAALPATAQCRLCSAPTTSPDAGSAAREVSLEVETSLDFDRVILLGAGEGTATLRPDGSRSVTGMVGDISGRAMVGSALVHGEAGRAVRVQLPRSIELHSLGGSRIVIEEVVSDLPALPRLNGSGTLVFRFGGRLRVTGDAEGEYRGDVPITVEYL